MFLITFAEFSASGICASRATMLTWMGGYGVGNAVKFVVAKNFVGFKPLIGIKLDDLVDNR